MARIRTIKPEFPQSESMGRVSRDARLLFVQLWTLCDDSGRARGNSRMLASLLFPYDDDAPSLIGEWLYELERENCIVMYEVEGDTYVEVANWLKHQKIDKPSPSRLPPFVEGSRKFSKPRECSSEDQGPGPRPVSRTKDHSVASQQSPAATSGGPLDFKKELWGRGVPFLKTCGIDEAQARSMLGKWRKTHGDFEVLNALAAAEAAAASEPLAYIQKTLNAKAKPNGTGQSRLSEHPLGIFGEIGDELTSGGISRTGR